eukprot:g2945.t1
MGLKSRRDRLKRRAQMNADAESTEYYETVEARLSLLKGRQTVFNEKCTNMLIMLSWATIAFALCHGFKQASLGNGFVFISQMLSAGAAWCTQRFMKTRVGSTGVRPAFPVLGIGLSVLDFALFLYGVYFNMASLKNSTPIGGFFFALAFLMVKVMDSTVTGLDATTKLIAEKES